MSVTSGFQDADGHWIGVQLTPPRDDGFASLRQWAPLNASMAADRAAGQGPGGQRRGRPLRQQPESTEVEWQEAAILVDGEATPFEVCHLEGGFWAAVGRRRRRRDDRQPGCAARRAGTRADPGPAPEMHIPPPPPPQTSERFPDELRTPHSDLIPPATVVDLVYRNRSRLTGNAGAAQVDLTVDIPSSASSLTGSLDGEDVQVSWHLSDNSGGDPELPASLEGRIGGREVTLRGVFRLGPGFYFDGASVEGDLGGIQLKATIERAEGGFGSTSTVALGALGRLRVRHLGAVNGSLDRGMLRGVVDGEAVHVNARVSEGRNVARLSGSFPGAPQLAALAMGTLISVFSSYSDPRPSRLLLAGGHTSYDCAGEGGERWRLLRSTLRRTLPSRYASSGRLPAGGQAAPMGDMWRMSADDNEVEFRRHAIGYWLILVENAPDKASAETTALERIVIRWREEGTADNHLETLIYDSRTISDSKYGGCRDARCR